MGKIVLYTAIAASIFFSFQIGRDYQNNVNREYIEGAWVQPCDFNAERGIK